MNSYQLFVVTDAIIIFQTIREFNKEKLFMRDYYVYILSNMSKTLYIGVTNNLERRLYEHKNQLIDGFAKKYNLTKLVYFETTTDITAAIYREKQLKGLLRNKKIILIEENNPEWDDLSASWNLLEDPSLRSG